MLNAYRAFVRWRRGVAALRSGSIRIFDSPPDTICLLREHAQGTVLACFNFGAAPATVRVPVPGAIEPLAGHGFPPCALGRDGVTVPASGAFFAAVHAPGGR